ncbi:Lrp/AsnC family transcriptional regulator [Candidatus Woesearchaeota archaeon]|nr:Lrp/AsnC family transcriptional regulator [Candidatus Woesearchaeota archaeon]
MDLNKLSRLLFELSKNSHLTTKMIAQLLNISQQSASYTLQKLEKERTIQNYQTVADPAKFGLVNAFLLLNYQRFDHQTTSNIKRHLKQDPNVIRIEETSQGADLLVEYCVPNLSYFNKQHRAFLYEFKDAVRVTEAQVVIVKHLYSKNYLHKRAPDAKETIISGDRESITLNDKQQGVLQALAEEPRATLINVAKKTKLDPKTIVNIRKWLQKRKIIRYYSILIDNDKLDITREHVFITLSHSDRQDEQRFLEYCKQHKNIIALTKTIGPYDLFITTERIKKEKNVINDLRKTFTIRDYRILITDNILKHHHLPTNLFENDKQ